MKNDAVVSTTPSFSDFVKTQTTCFDLFDVQKDIIELRSTGNDGREISINLIDREGTKQLFFGPNADEPWIYIDGNLNQCTSDGTEKEESTNVLKIQNGIVIQSPCVDRGLVGTTHN